MVFNLQAELVCHDAGLNVGGITRLAIGLDQLVRSRKQYCVQPVPHTHTTPGFLAMLTSLYFGPPVERHSGSHVTGTSLADKHRMDS